MALSPHQQHQVQLFNIAARLKELVLAFAIAFVSTFASQLPQEMSGWSVTLRFCLLQKRSMAKTWGNSKALATVGGVAVRMPLAEHLQAVWFWHVPKDPLSQQRDAKVL